MDAPGDICGVVETTLRHEFVCVRPPHAKIYRRRKSSGKHKTGDLIFDNNPQADRHIFVNKKDPILATTI